MKALIVVATLAVIANPAASMTLTSNDGGKVGVWIDYEAMKGADRLIHAGVNRWDPIRLLPFVACIVDPGTEITVTGLHAFYGYAEVVVASQNCAGVVHLQAIDTAAEARDAEARNAKARDAIAQEQVRICRDWSEALLAEAKEIEAQGNEVRQRGTQGLPIEQNVRAILKLTRTAQLDIRLAASRCPAFSAEIAKIDASAKNVEAACESRGFQWCRGDPDRASPATTSQVNSVR